MRHLLVLCALTLGLSGCSVFLAASPSDDYDLTSIQTGAAREDVEFTLGRPFLESRIPGGTIARYQFMVGDKANYHRASAYALLDILTVGLAEAITFPAEAVQGDRHELIVRYDTQQRVVNTSLNVHENPLPEVQEILDFSEEEPNTAPIIEARLPAPELH